MASTRVAVIGAGAAGLCALKHLKAGPELYDAVCFEINSRVGGTWVYTDNTGIDDNGIIVQSSMYKFLRTNLPKEAMAYPDYSFRDELPSYVMHQDVLGYLESYAETYDLMKHIKLNTLVKNVTPIRSADNRITWDVTYCDTANQSELTTDTFDAVMVCNGHYTVPLMPEIPGLDKFKGRILHSHNYRNPDEFEGQKVACLGGNASGQDISVDLSKKAQQVYICHKKKSLETRLPDNVAQYPAFKEVKENSVVCTDGTELEADAILLCTGYLYSFPFLSPECRVHLNDERITPLFKHMVHIDFPSLCFIGQVKLVCPFPMFDVQVRFFLVILNGTYDLPSKEEMLKDEEDDFQARVREGLPTHHAHLMGPRQWDYNDQLADMSETERVPKVVELLFKYVHRTRVKDIARYKRLNFEVTGPETFTIKEP